MSPCVEFVITFQKKKKKCGDNVIILWIHWYSLFQTLVDSAYGFQSQGGYFITCTLFSLACNDIRVNSEFPGLGLVPILHLGMVRPIAGVTAQCHFGGRICYFQILPMKISISERMVLESPATLTSQEGFR